MTMVMNKKGVALVWTLLVISVLLIVTSTMANYIVHESRMSVRIEDSTESYAIAQSGIEWAKEYISRNTLNAGYSVQFDDFMVAGGHVNINIYPNIPSSGKTTITSEGIYAGVGRKLQYTLGANAATAVANSNIGGAAATDKSYDFQFDLWLTGGTPLTFGLSNSQSAAFTGASGLETLSVTYDAASTFTLQALDGIKTPISSSSVITTGPFELSTAPYAFRVKVRYLQGTAAQMTVYRRNSLDGTFNCNGTATVDLSKSGDFSMNQAYFVAGQTLTRVTGSVGDGDVLSYGGSGYIDNVYVHGIGASPSTASLSVSKSGSGTGTVTSNSTINCGSNCSASLASGTSVTLTAAADSGSTFAGWSGACSGLGTCQVTMGTSPVNVTAIFNVVSATNLLTNGDFSSGLTGWTVVNYNGGPWSIVNESGNNVLNITHNSNSNWNAIGQNMNGILSSNKSYTLSFRYKAAAGTTGTADFRFANTGLMTESAGIGGYSVNADGAWHNASFSFTTGTFPANGTYCGCTLPMLSLYFDYNQLGTYSFDDIRLTAN